MFDCKLIRAATAAGFATALSLAAVAPGSAASSRHYNRSYYDYVPGAAAASYSGYRSENGSPVGPPDPASCGGFAC